MIRKTEKQQYFQQIWDLKQDYFRELTQQRQVESSLLPFTLIHPYIYLSCFDILLIWFIVYIDTEFKEMMLDYLSQWVIIICSKFDCSKNLLDTILLLLDTVRAKIFFLVNCSNPVNLWELTWFEQFHF